MLVLISSSALIAASTGALFVVRCHDLRLIRVLDVHPHPLAAIVTNDRMCATADTNGLVRVWPLTFEVRPVIIRTPPAPGL